MSLTKRTAAELLGTFWLVLGGCGTAVLSSRFGVSGVGVLGVALAFGLSVVTAAYALGSISGGHFNPAITVGLAVGRRIPMQDVVPYILAQIAGAIVGAVVIYLIARGAIGFDTSGGFAANGYGFHSPGGYGLGAAFLAELVLTFMFVTIALGVTDPRVPNLAPFAPLAIGLGLVLANLVGIPVTNASINPARSTGPALFAGGWAISQLWLFWVAPLLGAGLAGVVYPALAGERPVPAREEGPDVTIGHGPGSPAPAPAP